MPIQSRADPVPLLLTRPEPQATDFARAVDARFAGKVRVIATPLLAPRFFTPRLPEGPFAGLILTSQTGVEAYVRLGTATRHLPREVYCVGVRTADAARASLLMPVFVAKDAAHLISRMIVHPPSGALLHLRGRETRGDILEKLNLAGIETENALIYAQEAQNLAEDAQAVIQGDDPVLVPLFSPRTARIFENELARIRCKAPLFIAAISDDAALESSEVTAQIRIAATPDSAGMLTTVGLLLGDLKRA